MLTLRQKQIKDFVANTISKKGVAPTEREVARRFRISPSTAHEHIASLQERGHLEKTPRLARGIKLADSPRGLVRIPLLGTIAAGRPIEAVEQKESVAVPKIKLPPNGEVYALRVAGDSMADENIKDGDVVLVKQQTVAENGQKVVALIDNQEATLKKFYRERGRIRLQPANKKMEPLIFRNGRNVAIQGVVLDVICEEGAANIKFPEYKKSSKRNKLPLNRIICGDAAEVMKKFPSGSVDIVVTSPPYDGIRDYKGNPQFNLHRTGQEIYRVLKDGGVAVMVIQDQTKNFGKTLTSFRTIIDWCDNVGFKLFECVIYRKYGAEGAWWNKRFRVDHEYIPIFLKGDRPQHFNKEHLKIPSKWGGKTLTGGGTRLTNGVRIATRSIKINPMKCRGTIWEYLTAGDGSRLKHQHPATFPNRVPYDFIRCFAPKNSVVLDPFVGSGTTVVAAKNLGHKYIGIDIAPEYCAISERRIEAECTPGLRNGLF